MAKRYQSKSIFEYKITLFLVWSIFFILFYLFQTFNYVQSENNVFLS